jgi:hypothetical protein
MLNLRAASGVAAVACCLGLATGVHAAIQDETTCRGSIGARAIDGDVRVPSGAPCRLTRTRVDGNVKL